MTPEQITLVRTSLASLGSSRENLASEFYRQAYAVDPSLGDLFVDGQEAREAVFAQQLSELVDAMANFEDFVEQARYLGALHAEYGARMSHYRVGRAAFMSALEALLGERFDAPTREAWNLACNLVTECMVAGASKR